MTKETTKNNQKVFQCEECGFHCLNDEIARQCEKWRKERRGSNLEIVDQVLENKKS